MLQDFQAFQETVKHLSNQTSAECEDFLEKFNYSIKHYVMILKHHPQVQLKTCCHSINIYFVKYFSIVWAYLEFFSHFAMSQPLASKKFIRILFEKTKAIVTLWRRNYAIFY